MSRYQGLGLPAGLAIFLVGIWLSLSTRNPSNLHYTGLSFVFVGPAIVIVALMAWLSDRYDKLSWLIAGLIAGGLLFTTGVILALLSYMY
jgi:hypothetical protein